MHVIALRRSILEGQPWLARNLFNAFEESKRRSLERILDPAVSRYPVPWLTNHAMRMRQMFGELFPYGIEANRPTLELFLRYAHEQGIAHRLAKPEDIFPAGDEQDLQPIMLRMAEVLEVKLADLPLEVSSLLEHDISIADINNENKVKLLAFYRYLEKQLAKRRGCFVVIDCLADIAQMKESGRLAPNAFFKTVMTGLCKRFGVIIIVLAHLSKAAMLDGSWYSGGTGYKTSLRNKLVMKLVDKDDIYGPRTLETLKKNWGAPSAPITLTWQRGIFILDRDDPKTAEKSKIVIARILELIDSGQKVARNNQADGWTPKTLAGDIVDADGGKLVNAKDVSKIMLAAERRGILKYFEATKHGNAHYERGTAADDFEDGEAAEFDGEGGQ